MKRNPVAIGPRNQTLVIRSVALRALKES